MKKLFSILLVLVISMSFATTAFAADIWADVQHLDTASGWAQDTINDAFTEGFLNYFKEIEVYTNSYEIGGRGLSAGEYQVLEDRLSFAETPNFKANITRGQFAKMLVIWVMCQTKELPGDLTSRMGKGIPGLHWTNGPFSDIQFGQKPLSETGGIRESILDDTLIVYAHEFGIVSGTGTNGAAVFSPNATVTREQAATMIMRAVNFVNFVGDDHPERTLSTTPGIGDLIPETDSVIYNEADIWNQQDVWSAVRAASGAPDANYNDADKISTWAKDAVNFCKANGYLSGLPNGNFDPHNNYTVEQAIVTLSRIK